MRLQGIRPSWSIAGLLLFGSVAALAVHPVTLCTAKSLVEDRSAQTSRVSPASPLSLPECVSLALEHNPNLRAAKQEHSIQTLERPRAFASFLPTADIEGSYTRFQEKQRVVPAHNNNQPGVFDNDFLEAGLVLRLPIFQGGRRIAAYRIADLASKLSAEQLITTRQDLVLNVSSIFYKALQLEDVTRATAASKEALESQTAVTRLRVEVGRSAPVDAMKIEVRLASIDQQLSRLQADRRVLLVQLGRLMGKPPGETSAPRIAGQLRPVIQPLPDIEGAGRIAREQRSEFKAAKAQLDQAQRGVDLARADYWPRVDGYARIGTRNGLPNEEPRAEGALDHETSWAAGVQVDIPLFRGGAVRTQVAQAKLRAEQARERLRDVELLLDQDLEQAHTVLADSRTRIGVASKNVEAAAETLRIEQATYQEGRNTINDVLDAQAAKLSADVDLSQAMVDYLLAQLGWERALGNDLTTFVAEGP